MKEGKIFVKKEFSQFFFCFVKVSRFSFWIVQHFLNIYNMSTFKQKSSHFLTLIRKLPKKCNVLFEWHGRWRCSFQHFTLLELKLSKSYHMGTTKLNFRKRLCWQQFSKNRKNNFFCIFILQLKSLSVCLWRLLFCWKPSGNLCSLFLSLSLFECS